MTLRTLRLATSWGEITLAGGSRAGEATVVVVPQLRLSLDAGRPTRALPAMSTVFLSHAHVDHLGGLASWASQRELNSLGPSRLVVPMAVAQPIRELLNLHARLEASNGYQVEVVGVDPGDTVRLRRDMRLEFFATDHVVASLGCRVVWTRHRRLADLADRSPQEMAELRHSGTRVTEALETRLMAYTGDTGLGVLEDLSCLEAEILVTECSFFDPEEQERARRYGHLHLDDLVAAAPHLGCRHLVLLHPSRRHQLQTAIQTIQDRLGPVLDANLEHLMVEWD